MNTIIAGIWSGLKKVFAFATYYVIITIFAYLILLTVHMTVSTILLWLRFTLFIPHWTAAKGTAPILSPETADLAWTVIVYITDAFALYAIVMFYCGYNVAGEEIHPEDVDLWDYFWDSVVGRGLTIYSNVLVHVAMVSVLWQIYDAELAPASVVVAGAAFVSWLIWIL